MCLVYSTETTPVRARISVLLTPGLITIAKFQTGYACRISTCSLLVEWSREDFQRLKATEYIEIDPDLGVISQKAG